MAMPDLEIDNITNRLHQISVDDDSETQITVCSWNINGKAKADLRKNNSDNRNFLQPPPGCTLETGPVYHNQTSFVFKR